jgi:hypothetical protein
VFENRASKNDFKRHEWPLNPQYGDYVFFYDLKIVCFGRSLSVLLVVLRDSVWTGQRVEDVLEVRRQDHRPYLSSCPIASE